MPESISCLLSKTLHSIQDFRHSKLEVLVLKLGNKI